ncbi:MAG TPA: hypothetical protein PKM63_17045 [Panacibacter sp.]|nr:hypothetical protein [Panacibacter sp.]HNP46002.1 hypothetical protein [Panacibacter sp.]
MNKQTLVYFLKKKFGTDHIPFNFGAMAKNSTYNYFYYFFFAKANGVVFARL